MLTITAVRSGLEKRLQSFVVGADISRTKNGRENAMILDIHHKLWI